MPLVLKVNGRDLAPYLRVAHEDGLDPAPADAITPQFTGSPAIGEGQSFVGDAINNAQMAFPLMLKAATTDALYQLIRDIRRDLFKGAVVEYRSGGASASTFFDLEGGDLDPDFEFWLDQGGKCRAQLTIYRRPYGHSGTTRLLASTVGTGALNILASGLTGDVDAQAQIRFALPSRAEQRQVVAFGVKRAAPSAWTPEWRAASILQAPSQGAILGATRWLFGGSGRMASQYCAFVINSVSLVVPARTLLGQAQLPPALYPGQYRLFAGVQGSFASANPKPRLQAMFDPVGVLPPASGIWFASQSALKPCGDGFPIASGGTQWRLADLGQLNFPSGALGASPMLALTYSAGDTTASVIQSAGSFPVNVEGLYLIPIDGTAGVVPDSDTYRVSGTSTLTLDGVESSAKHAMVGSATFDRTGEMRGNFPAIPAGTSARVVALAGDGARSNGDWVPHVPIGVSIAVRERFSYLR